MKPVVMVAIGGALKRAHASHEFDGIKVEFEEDSGSLVSATCQVWRKGCKEPFEAKLYYSEYVQLTKDKRPVYMWATKAHVMLSKCAQMAALRLAFADELGGVYIAEEFTGDKIPDSDFLVRSTDEPTSEVRRKEAAADSVAKPAAGEGASHQEKTTMPQTEQPNLRSQLVATKTRILQDLDIPKGKSKALLDAYFHGFLDIPEDQALPKAPERYREALMMLDLITLINRDDASQSLQTAPEDFGQSSKSFHETWFSAWDEATSAIAFRAGAKLGLSWAELEEYLQSNKINLSQADDVAAFLRMALLDREFAVEFANTAENLDVPPAFLLDEIERMLDGKVEAFQLAKVKGVMASYALAQKL